MNEARGSSRVLALGVWLLAMVVLLLGIRTWLPPSASAHGPGVDRMINFTMAATAAFILLGHALLGYMLWRFGRQPAASLHRMDARSEKRWALAPVIVMAVVAEGGVLALGLPVWAEVFGSQPPADALTIEVTTEQFAWNVRYAGADGKFGRTDPKLYSGTNVLGRDETDPAGKDDIIDLNVLRTVVNRPLKIRLSSKDVLHSFFLPNFRVKQDSVPGMVIDFWFTPTRTGVFELPCAELCGLGHYEMRGLFMVLTREEFEKWLREQANG